MTALWNTVTNQIENTDLGQDQQTENTGIHPIVDHPQNADLDQNRGPDRDPGRDTPKNQPENQMAATITKTIAIMTGN